MYGLVRSRMMGSSIDQNNIKRIADGIIELDNHEYRLVLKTDALNFELKSEEEQDAITDTYESLLNSLNFPFQILIKVRAIDVKDFLENKGSLYKKETNLIYKKQIKNYQNFIKKIVKENKIITRNFYIVIGLHSKDKDLNTIKNQLSIKTDIMSKQFSRLGIALYQLSSIEIIQLFYAFYSPNRAKSQSIHNYKKEIL